MKYHMKIYPFVISYKTLIGPKLFWIKFGKIDGFIRIYDRGYLIIW